MWGPKYYKHSPVSFNYTIGSVSVASGCDHWMLNGMSTISILYTEQLKPWIDCEGLYAWMHWQG